MFLAVEHVLRDRPADWQVARLWQLAHLREEPNLTGGWTLLSLGSDGSVAARDEDRQAPSADYALRYWRVDPSDLVVNPMWLVGGGIGVSNVSGAVSPDYRVYRMRRELHPRFVHYLLRSRPYLHQYRLLMRANTTFDRRVTKNDFRLLPLLIPPLHKQRLIANYLDRETSRIVDLIVKKRILARALSARLQGLVDRTTDKESAPEEQRVPLKYAAAINARAVTESTEAGLAIEYIDIEAVSLDGSYKAKRMDFGDAPSRARRIVGPGDVIISTVRPYLRSIALIGRTRGVTLCSTGFATLSPRLGVDAEYLSWCLRATRFIEEVSAQAVGLGYPTISPERLGRLELLLPSTGLQRERAKRLNEAAAKMNDVARRIDRQTGLLEQRHQSLVTAAVTGQIEVARGAEGDSTLRANTRPTC